ncbi:MAG: TRAP transporter substrate-binding protein [Beijerinckiaceae bacterium]|nr:TRAP transporter substrate-binding protein [Beijerinckiaceae bacterium]
MLKKVYTTLGVAAVALGVSGMMASAQTVSLRMATWLPPKHHLVADTLPVWIKAIEAASKGTLKIRIDPAPIAKPPAQYDIVRGGSADLVYHVMGYTPGPFEIIRGVELPFLVPNAEIGSQAVWDWYDRNIGFDKEFKDVKILTLMVHGPGAIHTKQKITKLEDLKGVKLRVGGGGVRMAQALGAVPLTMPAPAAYEAIQKGVADGAMFPYEAVRGFRLGELVHNHLSIPGGLYTTVFAIMMNKKKYDGLSAAHKKVLSELGGVTGAKMLGAGWDRADAAGMTFGKEKKGVITVLSPAEVERWKKQIAFMDDDWFAIAKKAGLDGPKLLADLKATVAKYSKK